MGIYHPVRCGYFPMPVSSRVYRNVQSRFKVPLASATYLVSAKEPLSFSAQTIFAGTSLPSWGTVNCHTTSLPTQRPGPLSTVHASSLKSSQLTLLKIFPDFSHQ